MNEVSRKDFLKILGMGGIALTIAPALSVEANAANVSRVTPVRVPHQLPIYAREKSFLATGVGGVGQVTDASAAPLDAYTVVDDLIVPPECEWYIIASWGDQLFLDANGDVSDDYFGYNNDFTAYVPALGQNVGWLVVNHEYVSYPLHQAVPTETPAPSGYPTDRSGRTFEDVIGDKIGLALPNGGSFAALSAADQRLLGGEFMYNMGMSVIRVRRTPANKYVAVKVKGNRRVTGLSGLGINAGRTDGYQSVTSWGTLPHQIGKDDYIEGTGPAAADVFEGVNADGLGKRIIGTFANCSGGHTPWGTVFSCEENYQGSSSFFAGVTEGVLPNGSQTAYTTGTLGAIFGMVGEKYGWVVEINPKAPTHRVKKHTALGRFRHENIAFRAEAGGRLIAYSGDDRRGGAWWKFVSDGAVVSPDDPANSRLLERGTLYVAKFDANGSGTWIPFLLSTPTNPTPPSVLGSVEKANLSTISRDGNTKLPQRAGIAGASTNGGFFTMTATNEAAALPGYQGKTLADFYDTLGAALCDAFAAGNLIGATPCARPEDCEVDPVTKKVYMSNTDGAAGSDGYPDSRIFVVSKYSADINESQFSGDLLVLTEGSADGYSALNFTWERVLQGGEVGTEAAPIASAVPGDGFGNADNLAFGPQQTVWVCIDQSTNLHNGFNTGLIVPGSGGQLAATTIDHSLTGAASGLIGVFGNNWLFYTPTTGPNAGEVVPFAIGPTRCEMTGPTFIGGRTLILSVQHPGEECSIRSTAALTQTRTVQMLQADGSATYNQSRTITQGSQWPSNALGLSGDAAIPYPCVVAIKRKDFGPLA